MRRSTSLSALAFPVLLAVGSGNAQAIEIASNTVIGVFDPSSIVQYGNVLNNPNVGDLAFTNNTGTAVWSIANSSDPTLSGGFQATGSTLTWGTNSPAGPDTYSSLTFQGGQIPADPTQPFAAGKITFLNGTSSLNSLIFGATIDFYKNTVSASSFLGADQIIISTTSNQYSGTGLTLAQLQTDADYINICGNSSNICGTSLEAFEDSEGGVGVLAYLNATLVGDPQITLQSITLVPGQDPNTSGLIGNAPPLAAVPEPSTLALFFSAWAGLVTLRVRRRQVS